MNRRGGRWEGGCWMDGEMEGLKRLNGRTTNEHALLCLLCSILSCFLCWKDNSRRFISLSLSYRWYESMKVLLAPLWLLFLISSSLLCPRLALPYHFSSASLCLFFLACLHEQNVHDSPFLPTPTYLFSHRRKDVRKEGRKERTRAGKQTDERKDEKWGEGMLYTNRL